MNIDKQLGNLKTWNTLKNRKSENKMKTVKHLENIERLRFGIEEIKTSIEHLSHSRCVVSRALCLRDRRNRSPHRRQVLKRKLKQLQLQRSQRSQLHRSQRSRLERSQRSRLQRSHRKRKEVGGVRRGIR